MNEGEVEKASMRANLIEQRMYELTVATIETAKHTASLDIRRAQNDMKKRLRKYRDRQREIERSKQKTNFNPVEAMFYRQASKKKNVTKPRRPQTSPAKLSGNHGANSESDTDIELDPSFYVDHQKSKIDLRPMTSMSITRRGRTLQQYVKSGRLGSPNKQVRYFDEDELKERGQIYQHLVQVRITGEKNRLNSLDDKVAEFCEKSTIQTMMKQMEAQRKPTFKKDERERVLTKNVSKSNMMFGATSSVNNTSTNTRLKPIRPLTATTAKRKKKIASKRPATRLGTGRL